MNDSTPAGAVKRYSPTLPMLMTWLAGRVLWSMSRTVSNSGGIVLMSHVRTISSVWFSRPAVLSSSTRKRNGGRSRQGLPAQSGW